MDALLERLTEIVGSAGFIGADEAATRLPYGGYYNEKAKAIVRPASTSEVSQVLALCNQCGQKIVPLGGATGLVQGAKSDESEILLSLERMNRIETVNKADRTMLVQAGTPLQTVQQAAAENDLYFPLDLGARGSATIGGTISTNAGGLQVIRFGMMREQVLGLEAVLANGTVISSLNAVLKNNTGYDLKQLFIGSEGTLGVVTRAVLRLRSKPPGHLSAFMAVPSFDALPQLLRRFDAGTVGVLYAFEVLWNSHYRHQVGTGMRHKAPLPTHYPFYLLVELAISGEAADTSALEAQLAVLIEKGLVADAVIAQNERQRNDLWAIREDIETFRPLLPAFGFDVSLSILDMDSYVRDVEQALKAMWGDTALCLTLGHLGDGNIHLLVAVGDGSERTKGAVCELVYGKLRRYSGVISAEHGIGLEKREYLAYSRSAEEIELMKLLKRTLDPNNILNSGKVVVCE